MKTLEEHFADLTSNFPEDYVKSYNTVLNAVKALEIIKEKQIDVLYLSMFPNSLEQYNKHVSFIGRDKWCLTQEEYDLLHEVLL